MPKILGIDPGRYNVAFARLNSRGIIVESGHILPLSDLTEPMFHIEISKFKDRIYRIIEKLDASKGDCIVIERFIQRPGGKGSRGAVAEFTNIQIGLIMGWARMFDLTIHPISASTWKTYLQRKYYKKKGVELIDWLPRIGIKPTGMTDHEVDAAGMGLYWAEKTHKEETGERLDLVHRKNVWKHVINAHAEVKEDTIFTKGLDKELRKRRKAAGRLVDDKKKRRRKKRVAKKKV